MADDCLFCKIAAGEIPSDEVYSDEEFYAFRDINPGAPTHSLIIPRKHIARISEAGAEDEGLLGRMLLRANAIAAAEGLVDAGFRYVINCNDNHLHILGGRALSWPPG